MIHLHNPFEQEFWPCLTDLLAGLFGFMVLILTISLIQQTLLAHQIKTKEMELAKIKEQNEKLAKDLDGAVKAGLITINDGHIDIEGNILFPTGSSEVSHDGQRLLKDLALPLRNYILGSEDMILVGGFTDDLKIKNEHFPSNWELSTSRATQVVKLLIGFGVPADKIFAAGFGEFHPIVTNTNEIGRKRNRRVEISRVAIRLPKGKN